MSKINFRIKQIKETIYNILISKDVYYIVDNADWSIKHDGSSITSELQGVTSRLTTSDLGIFNSIIHYGSINSFYHSCKRNKYLRPHKSNKLIVTWFHIVPNDSRISEIIDHIASVYKWHTSCNITKNELISIGVPKEKIIVIPLGVDNKNYFPNPLKKNSFRALHGLNVNTVVIGSFQKDGEGWGKGIIPKKIKGPDILCKVLKKLSNDYDLFIVLTGPSRGYVINELNENNINFKHIFLDKPEKVRDYYQVIDMYIVTSRVEGGPKSILESMASGVPIVSTKVGMSPELIIEGKNGLLAPVDDIEAIYEKCKYLIDNKSQSKNIVAQASKIVARYSWHEIANRYKEKLYS